MVKAEWVSDYGFFGTLLGASSSHVFTDAGAFDLRTSERTRPEWLDARGVSVAGGVGIVAWASAQGSGFDRGGERVELPPAGAVAVTPASAEVGRVAIAGGGDKPGWVEVYGLDGAHQLTIKSARKAIRQLAFSVSGRLLAASDGTTCRVHPLSVSKKGKLRAEKAIGHELQSSPFAFMGEHLILVRGHGQFVACFDGTQPLWRTDVSEAGHVQGLVAGDGWVVCHQYLGRSSLGADGRVQRMLVDEVRKREGEYERQHMDGKAPATQSEPWEARDEPSLASAHRMCPSPSEAVVWAELDGVAVRMRANDLDAARAVPPRFRHVSRIEGDLFFWPCPAHGPSLYDLAESRVVARLPCPKSTLTASAVATLHESGDIVHAHLERGPLGRGYVAVRHDREGVEIDRIDLGGRLPEHLVALGGHLVVLVQGGKYIRGSIAVFDEASKELVLEEETGHAQGHDAHYFHARAVRADAARFYGAKRILEVDVGAGEVRTLHEWSLDDGGHMGPLCAVSNAGDRWLRHRPQRCLLERLDGSGVSVAWEMPALEPRGADASWADFTPDDRYLVTWSEQLIVRDVSTGAVVASAGVSELDHPQRLLCGPDHWLLVDRYGRWLRVRASEVLP